MSSQSRRGIRSTAGSDRHAIQNTIQKTKDLAAFAGSEGIQNLWDELCQKYFDARDRGLTDESFPYWVLHSVPHQAIEKMVDVVYGKGARKIESTYPSICRRFGAPQWQFVLFLGHLPQNKVRLLRDIGDKRRDITFDDLYRELCRIRSRNTKRPVPVGPFDFSTHEIRSYFQELVPDDSSEDDGEDASDGSYQDSDEIDNEIIYASSSGEDESNGESECSEEGDHDDIPDDPVANTPDDRIASPIHATLSTLVANAVANSPISRISVPPGARSPEGTREADRPGQFPDGELTADIAEASACAVDDTEGQTTTCTNDVIDQHLASLDDATNSIFRVMAPFQTRYEELKQDESDLLREEAEILEEREAVIQSMNNLLAEPDVTPEVEEAGKAKWSRLAVLDKKHSRVRERRQGRRSQQLKYQVYAQELMNLVSRSMDP